MEPTAADWEWHWEILLGLDAQRWIVNGSMISVQKMDWAFAPLAPLCGNSLVCLGLYLWHLRHPRLKTQRSLRALCSNALRLNQGIFTADYADDADKDIGWEILLGLDAPGLDCRWLDD